MLGFRKSGPDGLVLSVLWLDFLGGRSFSMASMVLPCAIDWVLVYSRALSTALVVLSAMVLATRIGVAQRRLKSGKWLCLVPIAVACGIVVDLSVVHDIRLAQGILSVAVALVALASTVRKVFFRVRVFRGRVEDVENVTTRTTYRAVGMDPLPEPLSRRIIATDGMRVRVSTRAIVSHTTRSVVICCTFGALPWAAAVSLHALVRNQACLVLSPQQATLSEEEQQICVLTPERYRNHAVWSVIPMVGQVGDGVYTVPADLGSSRQRLAITAALREAPNITASARIDLVPLVEEYSPPIFDSDNHGCAATFVIHVLFKEYSWEFGQAILSGGGDGQALARRLLPGMKGSDHIICVGTASREGSVSIEEERAEERAADFAGWISLALSDQRATRSQPLSVKVWELGIGKYVNETVRRASARATAVERRVVLISGSNGKYASVVEESLRDALTKYSGGTGVVGSLVQDYSVRKWHLK